MIVTFYSFKGGVGRTLALANIACLLAEDERHPQRVLVWDLDLDAPGITRLFPPRRPRRSGFIDYAFEYAKTGELKDVRDYIYSTEIPGIDVLPAGTVDANYATQLDQIDWRELLSSTETTGNLFTEVVRQLSTTSEESVYDYILIDSRTGLNDQAGICTQLLPELIVVLFRMNDQNLDGLEFVVPSIKQRVEKIRGFKPNIIPVVSAITGGHQERFQKRRKRATNIFSTNDFSVIHFDPELVDSEILFAKKEIRNEIWPSSPIVSDYQTLCNRLRKQNANDTLTLYRNLRKEIRSGDTAAAAGKALELLKRRPDLPASWRFLNQIADDGDLPIEKTAEIVKHTILKNDPTNGFAKRWLGLKDLERISSKNKEDIESIRNRLCEALDSLPHHDVSLAQTVASLYAYEGKLEQAIDVIKRVLNRDESNASLRLFLSQLMVRRGREFFSSAIDLLTDVTDEIYSRNKVLAYLWASLGDLEKAVESVELVEQSPSHRTSFMGLLKEYIFLFADLSGYHKQEIQPIKEVINYKKHWADWAEYYIIGDRIDDAQKLLATVQEEGDDDKREALSILANYCQGDSNSDTKLEVLEKWAELDNSWSFNELRVATGILKSLDDEQSINRYTIFEEILRSIDLKIARGGTRIRPRYIRLIPQTLFS